MNNRTLTHWNVFLGETRLAYINTKRYGINWLVGTLNLLLFLVFIQLGIYSFQNGISRGYLGDKIEILILGFFVFSIIGMGISTVSSRISEGASTGVLEHLMLSPVSSRYVLLYSTLVQFSFGLVVYLLLLPVSMLICRHFFTINLPKLVFYAIPLWLASCAAGFMMGALTIIYKKTQNFANLMQFVILALMVLPSCPFSPYSAFPISPQAAALISAVGGKAQIGWGFNSFIYLQSVAYLLIGMKLFKLAEEYAKTKGILGQY